MRPRWPSRHLELAVRTLSGTFPNASKKRADSDTLSAQVTRRLCRQSKAQTPERLGREALCGSSVEASADRRCEARAFDMATLTTTTLCLLYGVVATVVPDIPVPTLEPDHLGNKRNIIRETISMRSYVSPKARLVENAMIKAAAFVASLVINTVTMPALASQCADRNDTTSSQPRWATMRQHLPRSTDRETACRTLSAAFVETVMARRTAVACARHNELGALDAEIRSLNELLANECGG